MTTCDWCAEPAICEIELEPACMGTRPHPVTRMPIRVCVERAKTANACAGHRDRTGGVQIPDPRKIKADAEQLSIPDALGGDAA